jgi:hypothetical protein
VQGPTGVQGSTGVGAQGTTGIQGVTGIGAIQVALFTFTHTSGTASTGAIGFTPKVAFYTGAANNTAGSSGDAASTSGFATGTSTSARASAFCYTQGVGSPQDPGGAGGYDGAAIGGFARAFQNSASLTGFDRPLTVTAFGAGGISLTWTTAVNEHHGNLLVMG